MDAVTCAFYSPSATAKCAFFNSRGGPGIVALLKSRRRRSMKYHTDDVRITGMEEVQPPAKLLQALPISDAASQLVFNERHAISDIIHGRDSRLLVVIGPCSIHDPAAALEYAQRLVEQTRTFRSTLKIVMRVYFEKPRTTIGWKGLINDPHLNNSYDINLGLETARGLLRAIVDLGLGTGTEYLDPISPQYFGDLVCWGAIGARTTESQIHRQLASGLSCPVGFKNSTDGSVQAAVDAVKSARHPHIFLSVTKQGHSAIFSTSGNEDCHIILRGGSGRPNFDNVSVQRAARLLEDTGLLPRLMIDVSHANSNKDFRAQKSVCADICQQLSNGEPRIFGVMIESNLVEGRQDLGGGRELTYGQSVTDACLGWDDSVRCLEQLADAVARRNGATGGQDAALA
ncbi:MAG TPA: 3-deoxy-7-phosphoheptulonate synthase [Pseudomonadales bacterium]